MCTPGITESAPRVMQGGERGPNDLFGSGTISVQQQPGRLHQGERN